MKKLLAVTGIAFMIVSTIIIFGFAKADDPFFNKASQANLAEIEAGKLAESRGGRDVRSYGKHMVEDHTKAEHELTDLAKKQNLNIAMSPDAAHKQALADMSSLSGSAFDSAYIQSQIADHEAAIALFTDEAANGIDPSAKAYAVKYLPKLKMHLQMFQGKSAM